MPSIGILIWVNLLVYMWPYTDSFSRVSHINVM